MPVHTGASLQLSVGRWSFPERGDGQEGHVHWGTMTQSCPFPSMYRLGTWLHPIFVI